MSKARCEEVIVQLVVRTYDDGELVRERITQPVKVLRNKQTRDFWGEVDKAVNAMQQPPQPPEQTVVAAQIGE